MKCFVLGAIMCGACEGTITSSQDQPDASLDGAAGDAPAGVGQLQISAISSPSNGQYAPRNIVAIWIEGPGGTFVKTVGRWANTRKQHLVAWNLAAGAGDVDAVSGATRPNHTPALTVTYDLRNKQGQVIPDGMYTIRMESTDLNATTAAQNHQGTFTFTKGGTGQTQTNLSNGGFSAVSLTFTP